MWRRAPGGGGGGFLHVSAARSFGVAFSGRVLMGLGLAAGFIPGMKAIAELFPPEMFSTFNALFVTIGHAGSLVGAAPLAWMTLRRGAGGVHWSGVRGCGAGCVVLGHAVRKGREMAAGGAAAGGRDGARQGRGRGLGRDWSRGWGRRWSRCEAPTGRS